MSAPGTKRGIRAIGLPVWILLGALAGVVAGIVLGERTTILEPLGSAYAMMLQIAVYPYLICALLLGLGRLSPTMARRLLGASWGVYLFIWLATFIAIWLLAHAIPHSPPPSVITPDSDRPEAGILHLLIPANLIQALGRNYVPAVVVFAIVYGIAVQKVERKASLFEILEALQVTSVAIWRWIVRFAPIGVFALFATTAGTIQPAQLGGLLLYVGLFLGGTLLLAFVVLPAVLAAVAPVNHREILRELQPAFILAAVTTLSVVALPYVQQAAERIATRAGCPEGQERSDIIKTTLSLSYALAQLGNYFIYLFMLYAAYDYRIRLTPAEQLLLPFWTLLSGFGSPSATVDGVIFLGNWLRLPSGVFDLFIETWTVTRYGQVLLSVMGFGFVTTLIPLIYFGKVRVRLRRGIAGLGLSIVLLLIVAAGGVVLRPLLLAPPADPLLRMTLAPGLLGEVAATLHRPNAGDGTAGFAGQDPTLTAIQSRGVLRVGYNPTIIPFSYWNEKGDLVGFDIAYAYLLAHDLNVRLELVPFEWTSVSRDLLDRRFDIAMSGIYETDDRLQTLTVTHFYYESPVALIVRSERARAFMDRAAIVQIPQMRLAVFNDPVVVSMARRLFPNATIEMIQDYGSLPAIADHIDAAFWTLQQAGAWAAVHPGFTAVQPAGMGGPILFAYLMPPGADSLRQYLDQWLELKDSSGFRTAQLDYWIKQQPRSADRQRWNLLDALLEIGRGEQDRRPSP